MSDDFFQTLQREVDNTRIALADLRKRGKGATQMPRNDYLNAIDVGENLVRVVDSLSTELNLTLQNTQTATENLRIVIGQTMELTRRLDDRDRQIVWLQRRVKELEDLLNRMGYQFDQATMSVAESSNRPQRKSSLTYQQQFTSTTIFENSTTTTETSKQPRRTSSLTSQQQPAVNTANVPKPSEAAIETEQSISSQKSAPKKHVDEPVPEPSKPIVPEIPDDNWTPPDMNIEPQQRENRSGSQPFVKTEPVRAKSRGGNVRYTHQVQMIRGDEEEEEESEDTTEKSKENGDDGTLEKEDHVPELQSKPTPVEEPKPPKPVGRTLTAEQFRRELLTQATEPVPDLIAAKHAPELAKGSKSTATATVTATAPKESGKAADTAPKADNSRKSIDAAQSKDTKDTKESRRSIDASKPERKSGNLSADHLKRELLNSVETEKTVKTAQASRNSSGKTGATATTTAAPAATAATNKPSRNSIGKNSAAPAPASEDSRRHLTPEDLRKELQGRTGIAAAAGAPAAKQEPQRKMTASDLKKEILKQAGGKATTSSPAKSGGGLHTEVKTVKVKSEVVRQMPGTGLEEEGTFEEQVEMDVEHASESDVKACQSIFENLDVDRENAVSMSDLIERLQTDSTIQQRTRDRAITILTQLDEDHESAISWEEFLKVIGTAPKATVTRQVVRKRVN